MTVAENIGSPLKQGSLRVRELAAWPGARFLSLLGHRADMVALVNLTSAFGGVGTGQGRAKPGEANT
jgi:hypothetical protein